MLYLSILKSHKTKGVMYKFRALPIVLISVLLFTSCIFKKKGGGNENVSTSTGWEYNNPDNGGFEVTL